MDRDEDFYRDAISLTQDQSKEFAGLERAVKLCVKHNVFFYQNMDKLGALNGDNVRFVGTDSDECFAGKSSGDPTCLQFKWYPAIKTAGSLDDDNHFIRLHDE